MQAEHLVKRRFECDQAGCDEVFPPLAKTVFVLKRGQGKGFSGLINKLFTMENTRMIYGDAKSTISELVNELKS